MNVTCSVQTHTQTEKGRKGEVCGTLQSVEEVFVCVCVCVCVEGREECACAGRRERNAEAREDATERSIRRSGVIESWDDESWKGDRGNRRREWWRWR